MATATALDRTSRTVADLVRVATLVSALAAWALIHGEGGLRFLLLFGVLLVPRVITIARPFEAAFCVMLLVATWAGVAQWYVTVPWVDEVVHFLTNGAVAVAAYLVLATLEVLPGLDEEVLRRRRSSVVLLVTFIGLGASALWEFYEWVAEQFSPKVIHVGYTDTIFDMALGGLGSVVSGLLLLLWVRRASR